MRELNEDEIRWLLDDAFHSHRIDETLRKLGPEWTRRMLTQYLKAHPDILKEWEQAQIDACPFLENDLLNIDKKISSPKLASVISANIMKVLEARNPQKYGKKFDINLNQTVSIRANIEKGDERLREAMMRDVTHTIATSKKKSE